MVGGERGGVRRARGRLNGSLRSSSPARPPQGRAALRLVVFELPVHDARRNWNRERDRLALRSEARAARDVEEAGARGRARNGARAHLGALDGARGVYLKANRNGRLAFHVGARLLETTLELGATTLKGARELDTTICGGG